MHVKFDLSDEEIYTIINSLSMDEMYYICSVHDNLIHEKHDITIGNSILIKIVHDQMRNKRKDLTTLELRSMCAIIHSTALGRLRTSGRIVKNRLYSEKLIKNYNSTGKKISQQQENDYLNEFTLF